MLYLVNSLKLVLFGESMVSRNMSFIFFVVACGDKTSQEPMNDEISNIEEVSMTVVYRAKSYYGDDVIADIACEFIPAARVDGLECREVCDVYGFMSLDKYQENVDLNDSLPLESTCSWVALGYNYSLGEVYYLPSDSDTWMTPRDEMICESDDSSFFCELNTGADTVTAVHTYEGTW